MKYIYIVLLSFMVNGLFAQKKVPEIQLLQINSEWNLKNDVPKSDFPTSYLAMRIQVDHATLEDQGAGFRKNFAGKPLPIIVLKIKGKIRYQWTADLSFKLDITEKEMIDVIDKFYNQ